ncbi:MAG TPA: hypothetical protein VGR47_00845 [Terracidiphilus sp.]|nr:hypothetical protein [Terracidiphilus sp.]
MLVLCVGFAYIWAANIRANAGGGVRGFDYVYYFDGARCLLGHTDPYTGQGPVLPDKEKPGPPIVKMAVNVPTAFLVATPVAMMPWKAGRNVWLGLVGGFLLLGALAMWDLGAACAPRISGLLACFMLLNCVLVLFGGNMAAISAASCALAVLCFVKDRFAWAGVVLLALGLVTKPHVVGLVWLYFLLAGGAGRKRALQALGVAAFLGICAVVWIRPIAPHWMREIDSNLAQLSARGGSFDPGPTGVSEESFLPIISLQNALSDFRDDARFYNPVSYLIVGGLVLVWGAAVLRKRTTREGAVLGVAAVSALTLLPGYHRTYDAKILLLMIPACAVLWAGGGARRWIGLAMTSAAIFVTSDVPLIFWTTAMGKVAVSTSTLTGRMMLLALHPAPLVLLAAGCFYLWVYIRYEPSGEDGRETAAEKWLDEAIAE